MKGTINYIVIVFVLMVTNGLAQTYNTDVEAKIFTQIENEQIRIIGTALNKTEINQSLRYVLSVIKNNPTNSNRSKNDQSGRFVLESGQKSELSSTTINKETKDRIIILLLIYDTEDVIIGKDRIVFNDSKNNEDTLLKEKLSKELESKDIDQNNDDGIVLRGIVIEDVKTKSARDFYKLFYSDYTLNRINANEVVKIDEIILMANNTLIRVFVGDRMVHRFIAKPQVDYLKSNSRESIKRVSKYLVYLEKNKDNIQHY